MDRRNLHVTPSDLQSELEALRFIRRRSLSQSASQIDPDLPESGPSTGPPSPTSVSSSLHGSPAISGSTFSHNSLATTPPTSAHSSYHGHLSSPLPSDARSLGRVSSMRGSQLSNSVDPDDVPLSALPTGTPGSEGSGDLFWLPARLHPEIAPQEFKAFIKEATRPENLLRRSQSALGGNGGLVRKRSTLSRVYEPGVGDGVGERREGGADGGMGRRVSRRGSLGGRGLDGLESLTINDLQRLESIVDGTEFSEAAGTRTSGASAGSVDSMDGLGFGDRESRIRAVMRRSMSLGGAGLASSLSSVNEAPTPTRMEDDSPLISKGPGHIIRRTARTKVRKASLAGDGGGHRFPATRRSKAATLGATGAAEDDDATGRRLSPEDRRTSGQSVQSLETAESAGSDEFHTAPASSVSSVSPAASVTKPLPAAASPPFIEEPESEYTARPRPRPAEGTAQSERPDSVISTSSLLDAYATSDGSTIGEEPVAVTSSPPESPRHTAQPLPIPDIVSSPPPRGDSAAGASVSPVSGPSPSGGYLGVPPAAMGSTKPRRAKSTDDIRQTPSTVEVAPSPSPAISLPQLSPPSISTSPASSIDDLRPPATTATPASRPAGVKEKKSTWAKLGITSDKSKKDKSKNKDKAQTQVVQATEVIQDPEKAAKKEKEKDGREGAHGGGFFGGLFGGSKAKRHEAEAEAAAVAAASAVADAPRPSTAQAYLAQAQHAVTQPSPTASAAWVGGEYANFYRLPIHVERAIYRLSHIKLANPRRPLYEQVLISNLMFWYLGVINKPQGQQGGPLTGQQAIAAGMLEPAGARQQPAADAREESEPALPQQQSQPPAGRRTPQDGKKGTGARPSEVAIRPVQYDPQQRQLNDEQQHHVPRQPGRPASHPAADQGVANEEFRRSAPPVLRRHSDEPEEDNSKNTFGLVETTPDRGVDYVDEDARPLQNHPIPIPISTKRVPAGGGGFEVVTRSRPSDSQGSTFTQSSPAPPPPKSAKRTSPPEGSWIAPALAGQHDGEAARVDPDEVSHRRPEMPRRGSQESTAVAPPKQQSPPGPRSPQQMYRHQKYQSPSAPSSPILERKRERGSSLQAPASPERSLRGSAGTGPVYARTGSPTLPPGLGEEPSPPLQARSTAGGHNAGGGPGPNPQRLARKGTGGSTGGGPMGPRDPGRKEAVGW